jgi:hypothetical protein
MEISSNKFFFLFGKKPHMLLVLTPIKFGRFIKKIEQNIMIFVVDYFMNESSSEMI